MTLYMMVLNIYADFFGKMNVILNVLIDLKRKLRKTIVIVMKTKIRILNIRPKQIQSRFFKSNEGALLSYFNVVFKSIRNDLEG